MITPPHEVVIIGSGPAGLTAALYCARADLHPIVLEGSMPGGQLITTTEVENFPGFVDGISGSDLVETIKSQAKKFGTEFKYATVSEIIFQDGHFKLYIDNDNDNDNENAIYTKSVIIATGARPRKLGLVSEEKYWSKGVTSCATCDGFFYRGREVCVVGGGDSAMEEALFLTRFCPKVFIIHRRDKLRASVVMAERARKNEKIEFVWNKKITEILGDDSLKGLQVTGVKLEDTNTGKTSTLGIGGVFLGIGHIPNTEIVKELVATDEHGYVITHPNSTSTDQEGMFVCGDAQDSVYRQAITAAGTGCMAALEAERYLESL